MCHVVSLSRVTIYTIGLLVLNPEAHGIIRHSNLSSVSRSGGILSKIMSCVFYEYKMHMTHASTNLSILECGVSGAYSVHIQEILKYVRMYGWRFEL
jgi:hypothetical protein